MAKLAIDVVLLPSEEMTNWVIDINRDLLARFENKIVLNAHDSLPHISLCMGVIEADDLEPVKAVLFSISEGLPPLDLKATEIRADTIPTEKVVSGLIIEGTGPIRRLHSDIMSRLRSFLSYDVSATMLFAPPEIETVTFTWIKSYQRLHLEPSLFNPHVTVGFGETAVPSLPVHFIAPTLALCQLGNYCTCRKVLAGFSLSR